MKWLWLALGAVLMAGPAYLAGDLKGGLEATRTAKLRAQVERVTAERDAAHRDLAATQAASARARQAAEENEARAEVLEVQINDYRTELASRGDAHACRLTDGDARRMRNDAGARAPRPATPRR